MPEREALFNQTWEKSWLIQAWLRWVISRDDPGSVRLTDGSQTYRLGNPLLLSRAGERTARYEPIIRDLILPSWTVDRIFSPVKLPWVLLRSQFPVTVSPSAANLFTS